MRSLLILVAGLLYATHEWLEKAGGRAAARAIAGAAATADEATLGAAYVAVHLAREVCLPICMGAALLLIIGQHLSARSSRGRRPARPA